MITCPTGRYSYRSEIEAWAAARRGGIVYTRCEECRGYHTLREIEGSHEDPPPPPPASENK